MYVDTYYRTMQNTYSATSSSSMKAKDENETPNAVSDDDSVAISQEAKDLAEKNSYENRIKEHFSNTPPSLDEVEKELESLKEQYSESIQNAMRENGILGRVSIPKFTAMDGSSPKLTRPAFLICISRGEESTSVNSDGETVTRVESVTYASNNKNAHKFIHSVDNNLYEKIAAFSTILNHANTQPNFASRYNENPADAIASVYDELFDKIGYFRPEGDVSSLKYGFVDER